MQILSFKNVTDKKAHKNTMNFFLRLIENSVNVEFLNNTCINKELLVL